MYIIENHLLKHESLKKIYEIKVIRQIRIEMLDFFALTLERTDHPEAWFRFRTSRPGCVQCSYPHYTTQHSAPLLSTDTDQLISSHMFIWGQSRAVNVTGFE